MKTIFIILIFLFSFNLALAQNPSASNPVACNSMGECFDMIMSVLLNVSIAGLSGAIIVAGALFVTGGTPAKIALAKKIILLAVGIFVIILLVKILASVTKDDIKTVLNI